MQNLKIRKQTQMTNIFLNDAAFIHVRWFLI